MKPLTQGRVPVRSYFDRWESYLKDNSHLARFNVVYVRRLPSGRLYIGKARDLATRYSKEEDMRTVIYSVTTSSPKEQEKLEKYLTRLLCSQGIRLANKQNMCFPNMP